MSKKKEVVDRIKEERRPISDPVTKSKRLERDLENEFIIRTGDRYKFPARALV